MSIGAQFETEQIARVNFVPEFIKWQLLVAFVEFYWSMNYSSAVYLT